MSLKDYKKEKLENHIYNTPDTYVGGCDLITEVLPVFCNETKKIIYKEVEYIPALINIFNEILVNARDQIVRLDQCGSDNPVTKILVKIDQGLGEISIMNDGEGIDIADHPTEKDKDGKPMNIVFMILFNLLTSKNYDKKAKKIVGGKNGYGAKLTNIFSKFFKVETVDSTRGLKYTQESRNNMKDISPAKITKSKAKSYTKITWIPDFPRFDIGGYNDDMIDMITRRVYDIAGITDKRIHVSLNGSKLKMKSFMDYSNMYLTDSEKIITEENNRWSIGITISQTDKFEQCSFVNGIMTSKGGKHVDYVMKELVKKLKILIEKKVKKTIQESYIKNYLKIFLNSVIENPSFDSQTKERLITPPSKFGSKPNISDKFAKQIIEKTTLVEKVLQFNEFKLTKENKKTDGIKRNKIRDIPKLDDANWAGTKKSEECILILTEGDSAKSMAISGLSVVGRDKYGVFPLKGKVMNVKDASQEQILKNAEITNLKKILGLETGKVYTNTKSLRYGKVMIMTDQDHDGSHIKGLVMNVFHSLWSSLLEIGYITSMITPIVKVSYKKKTLSFYTLTEYNAWQESTENYKKWSVKYYKGLGTSNAQEAREYFKGLKMNNYIFTSESNASMNLAFSKIQADERKQWLYQYDDQVILDHTESEVPIQEFIHKELIHFSNSDTFRSIGSVYDGLKPSQRKILYSCFKRNLFKEIRVAQLAGYVSENAAYHHGEASLQSAIIGMAQDFIGSNNLNLLMPNGQFGTRIMGGHDAASCRYIHTELNKIVTTLFPVADFPLLEYNDDDGVLVEPKNYLPIIPMVLVNGMNGIGTGFSTSIPKYSIRSVIMNMKRKLKKKSYLSMKPEYRGFTGHVIKIDEKNYISKGVYKIINDHTIEITELPIGKWTDDYKKFLDTLICDPKEKPQSKKPKQTIIDYVNNSSDTRVHFTITVPKGFIHSLQWSEDPMMDGIEKYFKLTTTKGLSTTNMHLYDKGKIVKFQDVYQIMDTFFKERYHLYELRKEHQCSVLKNNLKILSAKIRFITDVINEEIHIYRQKKQTIIENLIAYKYPQVKDKKIIEKYDPNGYDYLIKISLLSFTEEEIQRLANEKAKIEKEYKILINKTIEELWNQELDTLMKLTNV
jgi:DNA topoisomerase-2